MANVDSQNTMEGRMTIQVEPKPIKEKEKRLTINTGSDYESDDEMNDKRLKKSKTK